MFRSSVVVDVSPSPVSISSAAAPYFVHNSIATIIFVYDMLCCTSATHYDFLLLFHWLSYSITIQLFSQVVMSKPTITNYQALLFGHE